MRPSWSCLTLALLMAGGVPAIGRSAARTEPAQPIRALILSGKNNHDWRKSTPFLKKLLLDTGRLDVRVTEEPAGLTAATLKAYDVLVLDYQGPRWGDVTEKAVEGFVRSGKGMVVVHGASYAFSGLDILGDGHVPSGVVEPPWTEYARMIGGVWITGPPKTAHGLRHSFKVRFVDRGHPIAQGLDESFLATDELYHNMLMKPTARVLATAYSDPDTYGTGNDEPILWTVHHGQGRVFHTTLGHDLAAMEEPGFITTYTRGAEWAATGAVTIPAKTHLSEQPSEAVRALVVTGGHSYPTSFYTLFEGYGDLVWDHAPSNEEAFKKDIREKYDVLVLYDLSKDIGEPQRTNLRAFVESGKGVLVLHHAIADYESSWPWWYEEVVGGRYLLEPDAGKPASTYKHDEEMFIEPANYRPSEAKAGQQAGIQAYLRQHPIVRGVAPLHLWDETYEAMWISPDVTVLLETDNPTSDGPVAWVSPYEKSRVVYIQLGHGSESHLNPGYRDLVRNAIFWVAERLPDKLKALAEAYSKRGQQ